MRTIDQCLKVRNKSFLSDSEYEMMEDWVVNIARYTYSPEDYAFILGWWLVDDNSIPLCPKEAGLD